VEEPERTRSGCFGGHGHSKAGAGDGSPVLNGGDGNDSGGPAIHAFSPEASATNMSTNLTCNGLAGVRPPMSHGAQLRLHSDPCHSDLSQFDPPIMQVEGMLSRLASMPWRRVDVSFTGCRMPYTAHNLIQV
jgi:hypothetical protein